jgi:hypothetical protein
MKLNDVLEQLINDLFEVYTYYQSEARIINHACEALGRQLTPAELDYAYIKTAKLVNGYKRAKARRK